MKVENELTVYDRETGGGRASVSSHWNNPKLVKVQLWAADEGITLTLSAEELRKAIDNATNTTR